MTAPPPGGDADREERRAALAARITDPDLGRTPLQLPSVGAGLRLPSGLPGSSMPAMPGSAAHRTEAERRLERVAIPATVLAGVSLLACVVIGVAMLIGWSGIVPLVLLLVFGVGFAGMSTAALRAGALARRDTSSIAALVWQSSQPWLGPLAAGPERRLVGLACQAVARIVEAPAWRTPALDDHRLTLDLVAELNQIDAQAYGLAVARLAGAGQTNPAPSPPSTTAYPAEWASLLDHVAALDDYARAVTATEGVGPLELSTATGAASASLAGTEAPGLADLQERRLAAGSVQDEFSTAQLRRLTAELERRTG